MIVWMSVACAGVALAQRPPAPKAGPAAPKPTARQLFAQAQQAHDGGDYEKARTLVDQGLAAPPKELTKDLKLKLLGLRGAVLLKLRDYPAALAAYQAYRDASPPANRREAQKIIDNLGAVSTTFVDVTVANGPADVYLDSKTQGVFCRPEPACNKPMLPGEYAVFAERPGFELWTGRVTVEKDQTAKLAITLVEKPSLLTVKVAQPGAKVTVDGAAHDAPGEIAPGKHKVVVALAGHAEARLDAVAAEGKPVELDVSLVPLVPLRVQPASAQLLLDGKPVVIRRDGHLEVPAGRHVLVVRASGFRDQEIEIPEQRDAGYKLEAVLAPEVAEIVEESSRRGTFTTQRKVALVVGGLSLVGVAGGVVLGLQAGDIEDDGTITTVHRRRAKTLQSQLSYGAAGVAAAIAIGLWIDGAPGQSGGGRVAVMPRLDSVAGIDLAVRF